MFQSFSVLYILVVDAYCGMYFMHLSFENWALYYLNGGGGLGMRKGLCGGKSLRLNIGRGR